MATKWILLLLASVAGMRALADDTQKILEYVEKHTSGNIPGGHDGGVYESKLPDGRRVVYALRDSRDPKVLAAMEKNVKMQAQKGDFAKIEASGRYGGQLMIVMEDLRYVGDKPVLSGHGGEVDKLRNLPEAERKEVRDRMLKLLDRHPDGHYGNVRWRKVPTKDQNGYRIEVKLVDPFEKPQTLAERERLRAKPLKDEVHNPKMLRKKFDDLLGLGEGKGKPSAGIPLPSSADVPVTKPPKDELPKTKPPPPKDEAAASKKPEVPPPGSSERKSKTPFKAQADRAKRTAKGGGPDAGTTRSIAGDASTVGGVNVAALAAVFEAAKLVDWQNRYLESVRGSLNDGDEDKKFGAWKKQNLAGLGIEAPDSGSNDFHARERNIEALKQIYQGKLDKDRTLPPSRVANRIIGWDQFEKKLKDYEALKKKDPGEDYVKHEKAIEQKQIELASYSGKFAQAYFRGETGYQSPWVRLDYKGGSLTLPGTLYYNSSSDRFYGGPEAIRNNPNAGMADLKKLLGKKFQLRGLPDRGYEWMDMADVPVPRDDERKAVPHARAAERSDAH